MTVNFEIRDGVAVITHDDGKANVYTHETLDGLGAALDRAIEDPGATAVLLVGRPGRFSAGFDLATMTGSADGMRDLVKAGARFVARLLMVPLPVVAACTGHALAAGALVLLGADYRIGVAGDWKIGLNEVSIGMALPKWAVELARYRLVPTQFEWRALLGQTGGPGDAVEAGFLDRVVPGDDLLKEAMMAAGSLAQLRSGAVGGTKRRARQPLVDRMLEGLDEDLAHVTTPAPT